MTTYADIMIQIKDLEDQAAVAWKTERTSALERAKSLVAEFRLTPKELFPGAKRYVIPVKYRDGQNTWTGRGKMPLWLRSKVESGIALDTFKV